MLRGDASGRIPFALVAVLLLMSAGLTAVYSAQLAREDTERRAEEARMAALVRVSDLVHEEVQEQAQRIALQAIAAGIDGTVNESRVRTVFRDGFADYVARHFPRVVRTIRVDVTEYGAAVHLLQGRTEDLVASNRSRTERFLGVDLVVPDTATEDRWAEVSRTAYEVVVGSVDYTLETEGTTLRRSLPLRTVVPLPAPLMQGALSRGARSGLGDVSGVGHTVKAIVATLVQYRVLSGYASAARPETTTRDVLTPRDVELAVNLALLLEQVRLFRTFDRDAADAADAARGPLPPIPADLAPSREDRSLAHLLDVYAANGTLDAVDLYAIWTGVDAQGLSVAAVLGQSLAAIGDQAQLKILDYLGLAPLLDFLSGATEFTLGLLEGFLGWLAGVPSRQAEYVRQYLSAVLGDTGVGTTFLGPTSVSLPARAYDVPAGSGTVQIGVPSHPFLVPFGTLDLLSSRYNALWEEYFPALNASMGLLGESLRTLTNDVSRRIAESVVLAGLLPESATGPIDPKDDRSLLAVLGDRLSDAVDDAIEWVRSDPGAIESLMASLWSRLRTVLVGLVDFLCASYTTRLVDEPATLASARVAIGDDLWTRAQGDPDFPSLDDAQRATLRTLIGNDVAASGWAESALRERRSLDEFRWRSAIDLSQNASFREGLVMAAVGSAGWLVLAEDMVDAVLREIASAMEVAGLRAVRETRLGGFVASDPANPGMRREERFRVVQSPSFVRSGADLGIRIEDPALIVMTDSSPNVHFTAPFELSRRPFSSQWDVRISGTVRVRLETVDRVIVGPDGLEPAALEAPWPLDIGFGVGAHSGWNLTGVSYRSSRTFAGDLWNKVVEFLGFLWDLLSKVVKWILDLLGKVVQVLLDLFEPLLSFVNRIVQLVGEFLSWVVELLRSLVVYVVDFIGLVVDAVERIAPEGLTVTIPLYGLVFRVTMNGKNGRDLTLDLHTAIGDASVEVIHLAEAGLVPSIPGATHDIVTTWNLAVGPLDLDAGFDPLRAKLHEMFEGTVSWVGSWTAELEGGVVEPLFAWDRSVSFGPFPTPLGLASVTIGVEVILTTEPVSFALDEVLIGCFEEAELTSWDALPEYGSRVAECVAGRVRALLDEVAAGLVEASLYVDVAFGVGAADVGVRLAFVADGEILRAILDWLVRNLEAFFHNALHPLAPVDYADFPGGALEHLWVRFELFFRAGVPGWIRDIVSVNLSVTLAASIEANLAAFGALLGKSWGAWEVRFGIYFEVAIGDGTAAILDVWLIRGTLRAY